MKKYFQNLFDYNDWANSKILEKLFLNNKGDDNTRKLMSHIVSVQDTWLERIKETENYKIDIWEIYSAQELQILSDNSSKVWQKFISKLTNDDFENICSYKNSKGTEFTNTYQEILTHVINHSTYHRGHINQLLRLKSIEPVSIDFITYVRNKEY
jgi:uncharacterized damage-inducible protein DinB